MAAFDDQEPVDSPSTPPPAARRLGYSSRGNASPVGETEDPPAPPLTLPGARDTQQDSEATALRRAYANRQKDAETQRKQDEALVKKTTNATREADFRAKGQKFYIDSFGDLKPEVDEAGTPRFNQSAWKKAKVKMTDGSESWALTRRAEDGKTETRTPKLVTSGDLKDPNLYHDFGGQRGEREIAGHVDDLAQSGDPETSRVAAKYRDARNKAIRAASLKPLNDSLAETEVEIGNTKLKKDALQIRRTQLAEQISALDSNADIKQTQGGFAGIGAEPTAEAKRLQAQRAALQAESDQISQQAAQLDTSIQAGGALLSRREQAKVERDLWANESQLGGLEDQAEVRRAWLKKQGRSEERDPVLAQIIGKQQEFGVKSSRLAARRATDDQLAQAGQTEGAALNLTPSQLEQRSREFVGRRNLQEEHVTRLAAALQKGERGPEIQAEMQKADAERRTLLLEQNRLTAAQTKLVEKQKAERTAALTNLSDAELMAGVDWLATDLKERQNAFDRFSGDKRVKKETVARVAGLRDQAQESLALLDTERKRRGLGETRAEQKQNQGVLESGARGILAGASNINRMVAGVLATGGDITGWDWLRDSANEFSEAQKEVGDSVGPAFATLNDVDSAASAFKYISGQIGTQAPIFGAAAAAGIMAKGVASIPKVAAVIGGIIGAKSAGNAVAAAQKAAQFTETTANLGTGVALQTGSIQSDLLDLAREKFTADVRAGKAQGDFATYRDRYVQPLPILTMGLATGLLEGVSMGVVLRSAGLQKEAARGFFKILENDGIAKRVLKSALAAEATEIPTELLQTLGERLATKWADPESEYFTPELAAALRETAAATLVSTGAIGAIGGIRKPVNDAAIEDAVRAIEQVAGVGRNLRTLDQYQQEEFRRPSMELIPAGRLAEVATAAAENPQDVQNAAAIADLSVRADASFTAAKQIAAAPDFVAIDPETNQPINDPASLGANRDAVRALVKVSNGYAVADLTEAESQGLELLGEQLGTEMVRDAGGSPIITDKAREWAVDLVPAASKLIRQTETERLASVNAAAAQASAATPSKGAPKSNAQKDQIQKEKGLLKPVPSAAPAPAAEGASTASVSFTNAAGKTERVVIPTGATVPSSGAPVRDQSTAEQYLAETSKGAVRDVEYFATKPGKPTPSASAKPNAGQAVESAKAGANRQAGSLVRPGAILPGLVKRMRAAGADDRTIANTATALAKRVNETVARYSGLFGGRVEVTDQPSRTGGFAYDANRDALLISTADLGTDAETLTSNPERVGQLIREEAIHRAAVRLEKTGAWKAADLWQTLTPATRDAFTRAYNQGRGESDGARTTDSWAMGHEAVRMLVQGRLAVENGRLTLDGAAISEETASPGVIAKIADILRKLRDYFTDLAGSLEKDGNDPAAVAEVRRVVELVTLKLQALEKANTPASPDTVAENTAETIAGEKLKGEWVKFAPESGTLGVPRSEMPQFQNEHLGALTQFLAARGITHTTADVLPGTLKPTQEEYSTEKVAKVIKAAASGKYGPRSILVSSDGYVLDRHHQFVAALTEAPQTPIPIIRFSATINELFDTVHDFPSVEYAKGAKGAPVAGKTETAPKPLTREPSASQNANAPGSTQPDAGGRAPAPSSDKAALAARLGVPAAQIGSEETVTHKGKTVRVVNVLIEAEQANTSHEPDGTISPSYPQEMQPRDRSTALYRNQQRKIAANPNLAEEALSGTSDRGTPIMARGQSGTLFTVAGNGRANGKALMYSAPDLAATAAQFKADIAPVAAQKGITPETVATLEHPALARVILDELTASELRSFSQASNEFSGAATNAVEQAKVDASRLTPAVLASFDPAFDLDAARNDDFRREFVRSVIGRAENITGPDLRRRVQAALFAKAFGDTEAGMAAFSRLAGEDDEGTRNLVRAMLDVAPAFAALRDQIAAGNLHDLDLAPALTRAVQEIAVALREKPSAQSADVALDGLVNQADLALDGQRDPLDDTLLRFLVATRRNRADLTAGLEAYVRGVYAAGDPKQADMFGAEAPDLATVLRTAVEDPQAAERALVASQIGRVLASSPAEQTKLPIGNYWLSPGGAIRRAPQSHEEAAAGHLGENYIKGFGSGRGEKNYTERLLEKGWGRVVIEGSGPFAAFVQTQRPGVFTKSQRQALEDQYFLGHDFYDGDGGKKIFDRGFLASGGSALVDESSARPYGNVDEAETQVSEVGPQGAPNPSNLPGSAGSDSRGTATQASPQGPARRPGRGLKSDAQTRFPGAAPKPEALRARSLDEIEATIRRNGVGRDRALDLLNAFYERALGARGAEMTARSSPLKSEAEADRVAAAIRAYDAGGTFKWPAGLEHLGRTFLYSSAAELPQDERMLTEGGEREFDMGEFKVTRSGGRDRLRHISTLWPMYWASYEKMGPQYANAAEVFADQTLLDVVRTADGTPVAFAIRKITDYGYKNVATGTNSSREGKAAWRRQLEELRQPGNYSEMSKRALEIALENNLPTVPAAEAVAILNKPLELSPDGLTYVRDIPFGALTKPELKRMVGVPLLWKTLTESQPANEQKTSGLLPPSTPNSPPTQPQIAGKNLSGSSAPTPTNTGPVVSPRPNSTNSPARSQPPLNSGEADLFGGLLEDYAQQLPPKAKRNKAEAKKLVAREVPALSNGPIFEDLFSLAQTTSTNETDRRQPDSAPAAADGGRAFTRLESDDLGPLFSDAGPARAAPDAGQPAGSRDGAVAGGAPTQPDGRADGPGADRPDGDRSGAVRGDEAGGLSVTLPGDRERAGGRVDARAAAESRRLARIARSRSLGVNEQNHRIAEGDTLAAGGNKTRLRGNLAAIRLLKSLQAAQRTATPEEKRTLAKYVGWGALSQAFDRVKGEQVATGELDSLRDTVETYRRLSATQSYYAKALETYEAQLKALENWDNAWGEGYRALKELLTPAEWDAARDSTENAHYTDRRVIDAMWQAVAQMGFKGGRVLEPAGGVGHFFGLMPEESMRASELFGVELDTISGGIFAALYPDAQIQTTGFEKARLPDNAFDLIISNVPFSENGPFDPRHEKAKLNLHNYFFAKALDKARPGGLVAFITTANTLEASPRHRAYLSELGDFIGAVRLPNDAFAANAGTQVTTDIVFMRKRDGVGASPFAEAWGQKVKVGEDTIPAGDGEKVVPITINEYFAKHPQMVLGTHSMNGSMYAGPSTSGQYTVNATEGDLGPKLAAALERLPAAYTESGEVSMTTLATTSTAREGAFSEQNGELGIYRGGTWQTLAEADPENFGEGKAKFRRKAAQFVQLRDAYRTHLDTMARPTATAAEIVRGMAELNRLYDTFVGEWGTFANDRGRHRQLKSDPAFYLLKGLERVEERVNASTGAVETSLVKADVFTKRTIFPALAPVSAPNPLDALRISQSWKGHLDLDYMAELLDQDPAAVKSQLIEGGLAFENPRSGLLETREAYLSGRVREKLRQAEAAAAGNPDYQRNVDALRAVQPAAVPPKHITPKLGGGWVPPALLRAFLKQIGFGNVAVNYTQVGEFDKWSVKPDRSAENSPANLRTFASGQSKGDYTGLELLSYALDQRTPQVFDPPEKKGGKSTFNAKRTAAANSALARLVAEWEKFAKGDAEVTVTIDGKEITAPVSQITAEAFNETFNGTVPRVYDGSHLTLPGSAPFLLGDPDKGGMRPHQKNGIWRAVQEGVAFLAHGVGAGKTRELIAIAMEWKRLGLAKKPMLVVHNPTLNQFANETRKIYPGARVLVAEKRDLEKENRRAFAARVTSGDWDLVVIAHSSFNLIDDDPKVVTAFVNEQKAEVEAALNDRMQEIGETDVDKAKKKDPTVKQLVKMLRSLEARLLKATETANKDDAILFQELGVDGLLVDEAHMFKKVPFVSKMGQVAGLDMSSSARASNLLLRLNDVRSKNNGRNVVLATGTPITNTLAEVWNMIRLTSPTTLKEFGVTTFDQFSAAFGQVVESLEMNPAGKWVPRRRFAKFVNGTGLAAFIRSIMDVQLNLDLGQPQIANGGLTPVVTKRTAGIDAYMAHLEELYGRWQKLDGEDKQLFSAIPLVISGVAKAATMDMRLIDPTLPDDPQSKVNRAIDEVVKFHAQETERKGTQIIFADQYRQISTDYLDSFAGGNFVPPSSEDEDTATEENLDEDGNVIDAAEEEGGFNLYRDIKAKLIARGIPESEIAIASDYDTDLKRADLFAKMNAGFIRVALGSTQKLGVGVNVQERLYALHHLDTPWTPADLEQRIGRAWRSGNRYADWNIPIQNLGYGVERTMDAGRYQVIETKSRFVKQAMEGKSGFEFEDPAGGLVDAAAELKAQFTGDPRVMEMVSLENQVRELELQADAHDSRRREFSGMLAQMQAQERNATANIDRAKANAQRLQDIATKGFTAPELEDIDARIDLASDEITADGALQSENARRVWDRILSPGVTLTIYAKGELRQSSGDGLNGLRAYETALKQGKSVVEAEKARADATQADTDKKAESPILIRVNAVLTVDGELWNDKGITSDRSKGLPVLLDRAVARAQSFVAGWESTLTSAKAKQAEAKTEMERPFEAQAELTRKKNRLVELSSLLEGKTTETTALADGTGPRGTMPVLAAGRATFNDPNQLEFEQITAEEMASVERVLAESDRAGRVKDGLPLADTIARKFSNIPGTDLDDVRQEARVALIAAAKSYDTTKGPFKPYAGTIIRNRLRDVFRDAIARIRTEGTSTDAPNAYGSTIADNTAGTEDTRTSAELGDTRRALFAAIAILPDRARRVLAARARGETFEEIAAREGVTKQAVSQLGANAMKLVRAQLTQSGVRLERDGVLASGSANKAPHEPSTEEFEAFITEDDEEGAKFRGTDISAVVCTGYSCAIRQALGKRVKIFGFFAEENPASSIAEMAGGHDFALLDDRYIVDPWIRDVETMSSRAVYDTKNPGDAAEIQGLYGPTSAWKRVLEAETLADKTRSSVPAKPLARLAKSLETIGARPAAKLSSSPADDEAAIAELMRDLARDVPAGDIDAAILEAAREMPGNQTVGNPDLANPAGPDAASRQVMNAVDEARKETMERETHEQWRTAAVAMIERDRPGVLRDLLAKASDGLALDNPIQVKAAQLLVNDLIQQAVTTKNPQAMRDAQLLAWSYREGGTEQARAFAARRDPFKRPADRYREFLAGAVFTPTPALRKQLAQTWSPAEKQRRIASLNKQLADARAQIPTGTPANAIPADAQKRISALNQALGEARQQKDRVELLNTSLAERMKRIEAEFAKMGVTLDDVFAGEAYLRLRGQKIDNNVFDAANYSAIKRRALTLIKKGWSDDYIARKTGLDAAQVAGFYQEHVAALRERLTKLGDAALDPTKLDALNLASAAARLASAEGSLSPEERAARIEQMIAAMGYARNEVRQQRTRRAGPARRNPTAKPAAPAPTGTIATEPGPVPAYPGATGRTPDDFGNTNLGLGEDAAARPPGATLPPAPGTAGDLANDAADARRTPGQAPAFPADTTGRANPYDFADDEAAPPAFDLSDPVQVAQLARTIQAIDGNAFDMVSEFWINAVLSGPLTQGANILGNSANAAWDLSFKRFGEAALNAAAVRDANAPQLGEFRHMLRAAQPALARAWRNALRTWTAESPMFEADVLNQQLDLAGDFEKGGSTRAAIPGRTGRVIRTPGRLLMATDDFFKSWIAHVEAAAQGYRIAKSEGRAGDALEARIAGLVNLPGSAAWLAAVNKAQELTFQEKHEGKPAGRLLQALGNLRELDVGGGVKPLRFVFPFVRTPFNIFAQGLRQSPAGLALLLGRFARAGFYRVRDGRPVAQSYPRPEMIKHTVEQLMAWTAAALVYGAAAGDDDDEEKPLLITGSIPYKDSGTSALNQRTGSTPYTVRLGGTMVSYGRIEPAATILGTTIDMIQAVKRSRRDKDQFDAVGALMQSVAQQAEEKTFLRGIGDLVGAVQGARKGERANYAAQFLSSFVPNLIRQPLARLDPLVRDRTGGFGERLATSIVPQLAEPKIDAYGEKIAQPGLAAWRALVPIAVRSAPDVQRVDRLLTNWNQTHPEDDWAPVPLNRTLRLNAKTTRQMTAPELRDYAMRSGRLAAQMLKNAALNVEKPTPDDMKRVKSAFSTARTITRRQMFGATAQEIDAP